MSSRIRELLFLTTLIGACNPKDGTTHAPNGTVEAGGPDASTFSITIGGDGGGDDAATSELTTALPWQESVRLARWKDAEDAIERGFPGIDAKDVVR